jgi:dTDP-D-glucose 4,6-dehydratase
LDSTKIQKTMGWQLNISLTEGLRRTVEYFRENEQG